jgi:hypothetical protein
MADIFKEVDELPCRARLNVGPHVFLLELEPVFLGPVDHPAERDVREAMA